MGKLWLFLSMLTLSVTSLQCGKDESNPTSSGGSGNSGALTSIGGTIENWSLGTDKTLSLSAFVNSAYVSFGSSAVDANGRFNISSLSTPAGALMIAVDSMFTGCTISNHMATVLGPKAELKVFASGVSTPLLEIAKQKQAVSGIETIGDFWVGYKYVNQDVSISGSVAENNGAEILQFSLSLKAGWNKIVQKVVAVTSSSTTYEFSVNEPDGGKWL